MEFEVIEQTYPVNFRSNIASQLAEQLKKRQSVVFIGMRRVGISNFLRFFLYHKQIREKLNLDKKHLFIPIDLNDLIERTIPAFWVLTLKRILDSLENANLNPKIKKYIENLFLGGIQSKNTFILIENIKKALSKIIDEGIFPTIFFIRFDRISESATADFFANLEGLKNATHNNLSFIFTTSRGLNSVSKKVFSHTSLSLAESELYLKPASEEDLNIISSAYIKRFGLRISSETEKLLMRLTGGYVQYLQLALISLSESELKFKTDLLKLLTTDERINLQSEELWEGLTSKEQELLISILRKLKLSESDLKDAKYILDSGFVSKNGQDLEIFSPIFEHFISEKIDHESVSNGKIEFSKKEHLLFSFLQENLDQVCEREAIIEAVWPEEEDLGVSDWAIDRLVARLRKKIKEEGDFEIITVKTRGFKLISKTT